MGLGQDRALEKLVPWVSLVPWSTRELQWGVHRLSCLIGTLPPSFVGHLGDVGSVGTEAW